MPMLADKDGAERRLDQHYRISPQRNSRGIAHLGQLRNHQSSVGFIIRRSVVFSGVKFVLGLKPKHF